MMNGRQYRPPTSSADCQGSWYLMAFCVCTCVSVKRHVYARAHIKYADQGEYISGQVSERSSTVSVSTQSQRPTSNDLKSTCLNVSCFRPAAAQTWRRTFSCAIVTHWRNDCKAN